MNTTYMVEIALLMVVDEDVRNKLVIKYLKVEKNCSAHGYERR